MRTILDRLCHPALLWLRMPLWLGFAIALTATTQLAAETTPERKPVPCQSIDDCWLDGLGNPISRPRRFRHKKLPTGDCGKNLVWLRHRLTCERNVCVARNYGDMC